MYREYCVTKTNDGGLSNIKKARMVVWIYLNGDPIRFTVR